MFFLVVYCANVTHNNSVLSTTETAEGTLLTITCTEGYELADFEEDMLIECQADGSWSADYTQNQCIPGMCSYESACVPMLVTVSTFKCWILNNTIDSLYD